MPLFSELRRAYDDGLIGPQHMDPAELDHIEAAPRGQVLEETQERHPPMDDVVIATAWRAPFDEEAPSTMLAEPHRASPTLVGGGE